MPHASLSTASLDLPASSWQSSPCNTQDPSSSLAGRLTRRAHSLSVRSGCLLHRSIPDPPHLHSTGGSGCLPWGTGRSRSGGRAKRDGRSSQCCCLSSDNTLCYSNHLDIERYTLLLLFLRRYWLGLDEPVYHGLKSFLLVWKPYRNLLRQMNSLKGLKTLWIS